MEGVVGETISNDDVTGGYEIANPDHEEIAKKFFNDHPDEFDELYVWTTFDNGGSMSPVLPAPAPGLRLSPSVPSPLASSCS